MTFYDNTNNTNMSEFKTKVSLLEQLGREWI